MALSDPPAPDGWPPTVGAVTAAQNGNDAILTAILAAGIPKLMAFYRGMGLRIHDAEDLASDTCEALVKSLAKLRDPSRFEPWFWRVARSKFYDHLRRGRRGHRPIERDEMHDDPSDSVVIADEHALTRVAFEALAIRDRELLWMRDVIGLEYSDMSDRLRMRQGAVRIAVMRARQRLQGKLEEAEGPGEG